MHMIKYISFNIYVFIFTKQICDTLKLLVPTDALLILTFIHPQLSHHPCESDNVDWIYVPPPFFPHIQAPVLSLSRFIYSWRLARRESKPLASTGQGWSPKCREALPCPANPAGQLEPPECLWPLC